MKPEKRREKKQARKVTLGPLPFPNMLPLPEDHPKTQHSTNSRKKK